ncbi:MAG: hypothetical protein WCW17_02285 [Patescibacteria group bacterium]|jgi:ribosomal protein L29
MKRIEILRELKDMTVPNLMKELSNLNIEITKTRNAISFGKEKNSKKILNLRKQKARIWSVITSKVLTGDENGK